MYDKCEQWARNHDFKFAEKKHELIYFSRTSKRFNMSANLTLAGHEVVAKSNIRILGI